MMKEKSETPRKRRTTKDIEAEIFKTTERLVKEKGFSALTFTEIMKEANVEPNVMYKRFRNIDELFDKFIRQYDYWFHDIVKLEMDFDQPIKSLKRVLMGLVNALYNNVVMQKILIWELTTKNEITCRTAMSREIHSRELLNYFKKEIDCKIDFNRFVSLIIGGIYYLTLHKEISTFCDIDYNNEESKNALIKIVDDIVDNICNTKPYTEREKDIALSLFKNNVDINIIADSTGIDIEELRKIKQEQLSES